ncbi:MAG: DNA alkylation repair protein [Candidatus Pacebacteria bacterium]|nr:DNA alkylation repair protein [Candidatus Paceibacterota bacterium]
MSDLKKIISELRSHANPKCVQGMARFGINPKNTLGVDVPTLQKIAKQIGKNHDLAIKLWNSKIHEARILAALIENPKLTTPAQMEKWAKEFDSWDVCDQVCMRIFDKTPVAYLKAAKWSKQSKEFVKRAGFALIASLAIHDKKAKNEDFLKFFPTIKAQSTDPRNYVRKAVNWALRQIGKRNPALRIKAIKLAKEIEKINSKSAKWIAKDAIRELQQKKFKK